MTRVSHAACKLWVPGPESDEATNFLDQDASVAGNQNKTWKFTVN
jgi:hypothetical protein